MAFGKMMKEKYGVQQTGSVALIRAIRDEERSLSMPAWR
jgi:hypothetical protein